MIIIPSKKFIFLRVPKTASTSLSHFFSDHLHRFSDARATSIFLKDIYKGNLNIDVHSTLGNINIPNVEEYKVFGVVREPVDRLLSFFYHASHGTLHSEKGLELLVAGKLPYDPLKQAHWLTFNHKPISNIYSFTNLSQLINDAMEYLGISQYDSLSYNHRYSEFRNREIKISDELVEKLKIKYSEDFNLYNMVIQKEKA
jgi:hypothetical protein